MFYGTNVLFFSSLIKIFGRECRSWRRIAVLLRRLDAVPRSA
ncbi:hypothetical protein HMPREF1556_00708 [Porphyromonas sp. oral taxon 278 str. W7784]|nr:hypothetical protein HMPREF1556_00708 [Porphyromonas sp. oral taxon 278 str. W7784]